MKFLLLCIPFLLLNLLQTTLFTNGPLRTLGYPDFTILIVIYSGLTFNRNKTLEIAFAAGLMRELYVAGGMGPHLIIFLLLGFIAQSMQEKVFQENPITLFASIFALTLATQLVLGIVDYGSILLPATAWGGLLGISIITGLVAIPMRSFWLKAFPKKKKYY